MRVAYTGARRPPPGSPAEERALHERMVEDVVEDVMKLPPGTVVVHGNADGVDAAARDTAREMGLEDEPWLPDPGAHGGDMRKALLARNRYVTTVGADGQVRAWASPTSRGTMHAWGLATQAGVPRILRQYQAAGGVRVTAWPELQPPRLRVKTGNVRGYTGQAFLDVTRGSGRGLGAVFAPTSEILEPAIEGRRTTVLPLLQRADKILTKGVLFGGDADLEVKQLHAAAWAAEEALWDAYLPKYLAEMRVSAGMSSTSSRWTDAEAAAVARGVKNHRAAWRALLDGTGDGQLGWDWDGARLVVVCCFCAPLYMKRGHCHARVLAGLLASMGAEDGGMATSPGRAIVCTR